MNWTKSADMIVKIEETEGRTRRISRYEHDLRLQMPCSDPECWDCFGGGKTIRMIWDQQVSLYMEKAIYVHNTSN